MFAWLKSFVKNLKKPKIKWSRSNGNSASDALSWSIKDGKLLFDGYDQTPLSPVSKAFFEARLRTMKEKIAESGFPITIEAMYIEPFIATGLWNEGSITTWHLQNANNRYGGITFEWEMLGEPILVSIQRTTYYMSYEFIVRGHPDGTVRVRDIPDALAIAAKENVF